MFLILRIFELSIGEPQFYRSYLRFLLIWVRRKTFDVELNSPNQSINQSINQSVFLIPYTARHVIKSEFLQREPT